MDFGADRKSNCTRNPFWTRIKRAMSSESDEGAINKRDGSVPEPDNHLGVMRQLSTFLRDFESSVHERYITKSHMASPVVKDQCIVDVTDKEESEGHHMSVEEHCPHGSPLGTVEGSEDPVQQLSNYSIEDHLKEFDTIIQTSREAQKNALGLADSLQGVFHSVMKERNQAVDDLKRSVNLLQYSVGKLHDMREKMQQMIQKEGAHQLKMEETEKKLRDMEQLRDVTLQKERENARKEADLERLVIEFQRAARSLEMRQTEFQKELKEMDAREKRVSQHQKTLRAMEDGLQQTKKDLDAVKEEIGEDQKRLKEEGDSVNAQRLLIDKRAKELAVDEERLRIERQEWEIMRQKEEEELREMREQIDSRRKETEDLISQRDSVLESLETYKAGLEEKKNELVDLKKAHDVALEKLDQIKSLISEKETELEQLDEKIGMQAEEIQKGFESLREATEKSRAEIAKITHEKAEFERLKRDIVVQGHKALETAEMARKEQITLACIKRENIEKASQLYIRHLEAAMKLDSPDFLRNLLEKHFSRHQSDSGAPLERQKHCADQQHEQNDSGTEDFSIPAYQYEDSP